MTERLDRIPRPADHAVARHAGEEAILLELTSGTYFSLDAIGCRIWQLCDGNRTGREIAREIALEYEVQIETVERDVAEFLNELERERLVDLA